MADAKYKLPANWEETCDGHGCDCGAYSQAECGCPDADWTPSEVYELREEVNALLEALQKVVAFFEDCPALDNILDAEVFFSIEEMDTQARAAIAKATI